MANKNIFEMLNLEFDPPDSLKKIRAAYENWKKRLASELNTTVEPARIAAIKSELAMDNYIRQIIENSRLRQHEAESLKQIRIEQLRLYIDIQRGDVSGTLQVNQSQIRQIKDKLKLSTSTIETTYKEQGFEVKTARTGKSVADTLNGFFISDSVMAELRKNFSDFQTVPDEQNYSWAAEVNDFYDLAYYLENKIEPSPAFYKRRDTDELREIFQNEAKKVSAPIPAWQSIKALLNLAQTQIFNSDDNRFKYDHTLRIERLSDFFNKLKAAPDIFKRDRYFADNCINRIRRTFPNLLNYELSAALYNKAAGLLKDPYESVNDVNENFFSLTCTNCGTFESFRTREEAINAACKVCGESFYIDCPKCGKKIPVEADHCPTCEFSLSEYRRYGYYIDQANAILDIIERNAKTFDDSVEGMLLDVIDNLARAKVLKSDSIDVTKVELRIKRITAALKNRELIKWAESKMPTLNAHQDTAVSACIEILRRIKDYKPALDRLRLIVPKKPLKVTAIIHERVKKSSSVQNTTGASILNKISVKAKSTNFNNAPTNLICTVTWQPDNDLGVVYTLVRKVDGIPKNYHDGDIIAENANTIEVNDNNIYPGIMYGYAVFAVRLGIISEPVTCSVVHYSDIEENKLIAKTEDGHCKFTWKLPSDNCLGVRILRSDRDGNNVIVADCVQSPFVDRLVKNRKQYQYRLQCVYYSATEAVDNLQQFLAEADNEKFNKVWKVERTLKYSEGLTINLTPELPPRPVKNLNFSVSNGRINFNWHNTGEFEIWFKEIADDNKIAIEAGKIFELNRIDEVLGNGIVFKRVESLEQTCEFEISGDLLKVAIISANHNFGLLNDIVTVANVEACEIDADKTEIDSGELKIVLKTLPQNLYMIHYKISTEDSDEIYATIDDAKARHLNRVYATKYAQDTFITQSHLPYKELYITVIGEYKLTDGTAAYSTPSKIVLNNRPKAEISYRLEWGKSGIIKKKAQAKNCKLIIESTANNTPKMFLVCRKDGRMNVELNDPETQILYEVPESANGFTNGVLEIPLSNKIWADVEPDTFVQLLIAPNDEKYFELKVSAPDSLQVPKK